MPLIKKVSAEKSVRLKRRAMRKACYEKGVRWKMCAIKKVKMTNLRDTSCPARVTILAIYRVTPASCSVLHHCHTSHNTSHVQHLLNCIPYYWIRKRLYFLSRARAIPNCPVAPVVQYNCSGASIFVDWLSHNDTFWRNSKLKTIFSLYSFPVHQE